MLRKQYWVGTCVNTLWPYKLPSICSPSSIMSNLCRCKFHGSARNSMASGKMWALVIIEFNFSQFLCLLEQPSLGVPMKDPEPADLCLISMASWGASSECCFCVSLKVPLYMWSCLIAWMADYMMLTDISSFYIVCASV